MTERSGWLPGECELLGEVPAPPDHRALRRGTTKYPFEELEVGHVMRVKRSVSAVREAIRRYVLGRGAGRSFRVYRRADGYVEVRRSK
jgi:hypothetical protein